MARLGIRRRLGYANVVATLALLVALVGSTSAIAAVIITNNNQVAQNTISGHHPPTGKHANLISGTINATDLQAAFTATLKDQCPAGTMRAGGLCIEPTLRTQADWLTALETCQAAGLRLPTIAELLVAFDHLGAPQNFEWAEDLSTTSAAPEVVEQANRSIQIIEVTTSSFLQYRCVTTATD